MEKRITEVCGNEQFCSIEDELQLIKDIKSKGAKKGLAIEKLSHSKLRLVTAVAKKFKGCNLSTEELISAGNEGLVLAAEKYDESSDFKFMSYAVWWIRQSIMQKYNKLKQDYTICVVLFSCKMQYIFADSGYS